MKKINIPFLTLGISILTAYGYFIAYSYEVGYLSAFEIPSTLVQVGLDNVIFATVSFSTVLGLIFAAIFLSQPYLEKYRTNLFIYPLILFLLIYIITSLFFYVLNPENIVYLPFLGLICAILILCIDFLFPLIRHRSINNFALSVVEDRGKSSSSKKSLSTVISKNTYANILIITFFLLFLSYLFSSTIGQSTAILGSKTYYVFEEQDKNYALIRSYSKYMVAVSYKNNMIIPGEVYLLNIEKLNLRKQQLEFPKEKVNDDSVNRFNQFIRSLIRVPLVPSFRSKELEEVYGQ